MIKFTLLFIIVLLPSIAFGQKQANVWYFGNGAGLDFNDNCLTKVLTDGAINGFEGCATIADKNSGQVLIYTNSANVWDRNHNLMPNGNLITNGSTITQVTIVQKPGFDSIYYIVTSEVQGFSGQGYRFHQVDMSLNGGLGGLTFKDSILYLSPVTEKIIPVQHSNGTDIWLLGHQYNSNQFLSFLLNSNGINTSPVISAIGKIHSDNSTADAVGELKASPNSSKLAVVTLVNPNIELFDFDNSTGLVSNLITLPENGGYNSQGNPSGLYGLSFSPDNSKLYASQWLSPSAGVSAKIIQYDLSSNDSASIQQSRVNIFSSATKNLYSLKLAPDRKIYVAQNQSSSFLGVINDPDSSGLGCNYVDQGIYLNGKFSSWGLNNLMEYDSYCALASNYAQQQTYDVKFFPNPFSLQTVLETTYPLHNAELRIYNLSGQLVTAIKNINSQTIRLNRGELPSGIYIAKLTAHSKTIATHKIVIIDN